MAQVVELGTWGRWLLAILITAIMTLLTMGYAAMDRRMMVLENWRSEQGTYQTTLAREVGEIATRQQAVLKRLDENSMKLDRLLELYFQHVTKGKQP